MSMTEIDNTWTPKVIQGGKGPPTDVTTNWLKDLKKGAVFSCKEKGKTSDLEILVVAFKHQRTIVLVDALNSAPRRAVDPDGFCKKYDWFETLEEGGEHPEEVQNGNDPRTIRPSGVADNADAPGGQQEHDNT